MIRAGTSSQAGGNWGVISNAGPQVAKAYLSNVVGSLIVLVFHDLLINLGHLLAKNL